MRIRPLVLALVASVAALTAPVASAAPCAGFTDLDDSSPFCTFVEWIKNRGVTTGCGAGTTYCPNDVVTRLSMAAFLKRLGDALTPVDLTPVAAGPTAGVAPNGNPVLCATPDFLVANFPRRAFLYGAAVLSAPSANIDVKATVVFSTNGGTTWTAVNNSDQYATLYSGATPAHHASLAPFGWIDLSVNQSVRFGVRLEQFAGSGTVTASCQNRVQVVSRTGASSPVDAGAVAQRTGGGS